MTKLLTILMLTLTLPAMAADIDSKQSGGRHVADDVEVLSLPNGEVVMRLVSRSGITARQYWVDSVYRAHASILVFEGKGGLTQISSVVQGGPTEERQVRWSNRVLDDMPDFRQLVSGRFIEKIEDKDLSQVVETRE